MEFGMLSQTFDISKLLLNGFHEIVIQGRKLCLGGFIKNIFGIFWLSDL